ncbi:hypothetical protein HOP50_09g54370 [Chloropicon primus]|uniref:Uncharacterized protein n=1 Tax=Chloropicon primus TaxID=1764295 RepID=A0A5B8MQB1_9CHLO|nr:hypothetical protein A3770_09p54060 [Chloropicon primus]UPR02112.1 hypothetical protein HOP50_09g54370 [Chloropicon primus]|mmetsp:Transcript_8161/g.23322  ORF Transcript_8161/g.23322 Transcript_8161/m.23322 type:complete len:363 (+) Transcript_8161:389-1477(+)|eukprot:QDZ22888.1 hypothetical protein A3770_09p54060 [Chloropicon primus]
MVWTPWGRGERDKEGSSRRKHRDNKRRGDELKSVLEHDRVDDGKRALEDWARSSREALERTSAVASSVSSRDVVPLAVSCAASLSVHCAVLKGCQVASASVLRVSCATPVLSTLVGGATVALASVASGSISRALQQPLLAGDGRRRPLLTWGDDSSGGGNNPFWEAVRSTTTTKDVLLDAAVGLACFAALGGRARSVLASDVRYPGANARASMPAVGASYATKFQRSELLRMLRLHGCHHCGKRSGPVIADHMPPNHFVEKARQGSRKGLGWVLTKMRFSGRLSQRFYPQCRGCSQKQAVAVKKNAKSLVTHLGGWHPHYLAGPFVMFRTYDLANQGTVLQNAQSAKEEVGKFLLAQADKFA